MRYSNTYLQINGKRVKQINKIQAEKMYNEGKNIYIQASNIRINSHWQPETLINKNDWQNENYSFPQLINNFIIYNCDNVRGRYPVFFVEF